MANQAIALQARAPQGNFLAPAIQQGAQMINIMSQQRAAERQAAIAQQTMEIQRAAEGRAARGEDIAVRKANQEYTVAELLRLRDRLPKVGSEAGWQMWLSEVEKVIPTEAAQLREFSPNYDPQKMPLVAMGADDYINKTIATPMASLQIGADNKAFSAVVGGTNPSVTPLTVAPAPSATVSGVPARAAPATPAPAPPAPAAGGTFQPISATGGQPQGEDPATAALAASLTKAQGTKQIDAGTVEQIKTMIQPELVDRFIQANGIQVSPGGGMRSAVYRPGQDAAPQMQMVQAYNQPGSQFQVAKDPTQSPAASAPGIYRVPTPQIAGAAAAQEGGTQGVRVVTEPKIAGGKKKAELQAEKEIAFPDAQGQFETALATIDNRLADIKRFREHPARDRVIGPLDAFTPNFGRARGAQAIYDALVATATLDELQQMRKASPTGGALGNVSDADIRILRQSIGAMGQDQPEEDFMESLGIFENRLKQTRDQLIRRYRENYGYKLGKSWNPPTPTARAPAAGKRSSSGFTVMEVQD
jgi:hypothetical protein